MDYFGQKSTTASATPLGAPIDSPPAPANAPPPPSNAPPTVKTATTSVRLGFLRKVYTLLTINFLITIGISCAFAFVDSIRTYVTDHSWVIWASLAVSFAALFTLSCIKTKFPINLLLMYFFVLTFSVLIATIVAFYFEADAGGIVLQAFCATAAVFVAITAYVFITRKDFSFLYGFLSGAFVVLLVLSIVNFALGWVTGQRSRGFSFAISVLGALVMTGYLLFDTSMVITRVGPDDWVYAVVSLYVDVTTLFLYLLNIFSFANS